MPSKSLPTREQNMKNAKEESKVTRPQDRKDRKQGDTANKTDKQSAVDCTQHWEDEAHMEAGKKEYQKFKETEQRDAEARDKAKVEAGSDFSETTSQDGSQQSDEEQPTAKKRGGGVNQREANKKQKRGSKGEPSGIAGDKTRVPEKGQKVQWKALSEVVAGEVVEVVYEEKTIDGKPVKGTKEDPRIALKSSSSGEISVHKPEAVYFQ